VIFITKG